MKLDDALTEMSKNCSAEAMDAINDKLAKIAVMENVLRHARKKLELYRGAHGGEYLGGIEYSRLISNIDEALK